jgi:predicted RNase H-like HicB family nuclease
MEEWWRFTMVTLGEYETYMAVTGDTLEEAMEYAEGIMEVL